MGKGWQIIIGKACGKALSVGCVASDAHLNYTHLSHKSQWNNSKINIAYEDSIRQQIRSQNH